MLYKNVFPDDGRVQVETCNK